MSNSRLYIDGSDIPIFRDISIPTTYKIADIREPSKRDADTTLSIEIPSTKEIDEIFEFCFEVNISLQNFNPNLKTSAKYYINNTEVLVGALQLERLVIMPLTNEVIYYCNIKGQLTDLFYSIGEKYLTGNDDTANDLDFSDYDHVLNKTKVLNTWDTSVVPNTNVVSGIDTAVVAGIGYRYPLIDYGLNNGDSSNYYYHHLRPGLFAYEYLLKIFELAGKTWTSAFLDSTFFKSKMIPCTELVSPTQSAIDNKSCYVGDLTGGIYLGSQVLTMSGAPNFDWTQTAHTVDMLFPIDNSAPYSDAGNIYATGTGKITVPQTGLYTVKASFGAFCNVVHSSGVLNYYVDTYDADWIIYIEKWDGSTWVNIGTATAPTLTGASSGSSICGLGEALVVSYTGVFTAGQDIRLRTDFFISNILIRDIPRGAILTTGTAYLDFTIPSYNPADPVSVVPYFSIEPANTNINEGDTLEMNQTIPKKIKQKDFFTSIINAFNLYVLPDKTNPDNYFIEPRIDFYSTDFVDWTDKLDASKGIEVSPMGELDTKQFKFKYSQGDDYFNKVYQDAWQEIYGEVTFEAENEFVNGDKTNQLIFSPTPLIGNDVNDLVIPKIYKNNNWTITHDKDNIRLLHWGEAIPNSIGWYLYTLAGLDTVKYEYPYAGHLDDPYAPTFDLSFGVPNYVFFNIDTYPTTNLFTEYHYDFMSAITDKNSKIITAYFFLDEIDIQQFDFRKMVFVNGTYYLVNAIIDFDVLDQKTTKVELLKIL